ncbi:M15 family metallopeptidase [Turneriella parva]|uniref:Peptidase M15B and M15C DD-carboxypeptidase VanY/endolysin n=1 Tax=Turneriella parva (strain ATCC BAA-1111 / DSM 21527 / NCTC 11395 / H) TaxID=869212 RepID=I4B6K5_TURPD|nr:M15 family metallopeptidase [Turneriella parva]AFM12912.1 peptidase M15B and M15C DD-carboxypeptidase VanY/endolysin [Turneriella parva DSM 21527]
MRARFVRQSLVLGSLYILTSLFAQADLRVINGKFSPEKRREFVPVPAALSPGRKQYLHAETLAALAKLAEAAKKSGFNLTVVSATRNFTTQKAIWEEKFTGKRLVGGKNLATAVKSDEERALTILNFSSMPGTSRHHWGTDIDFHEAKMTAPALHNSSFKSGRGLEFYNWLVANGPKFGFCQPYNGDPNSRHAGKFAHGYQEERWHWSYRPLASQYLKRYQQNAGALEPSGFAGDKASAKFYMDYVQNIDASCY